MGYIKSAEAVKYILEGGKILGEILEKLGDMVAPGVSAYEIDLKAFEMIKRAGGRAAFLGYRAGKNSKPFPNTICASVNDEVVHGFADKEKILKSGDIISIDIGMEYPYGVVGKRGYFTDTAITVPVGKIDKKYLKLLDVTRDSLERGIEACVSGNSVADVGKAVESSVKKAGNYGIVRDLCGHGVGDSVHEDPEVLNYFAKYLKKWDLRPGVVIAIEPMITTGGEDVRTDIDGWTVRTADGSWCGHFEHTVIITADGPIVATRRPSEL
ncbi:MAG TPA: type I methionyl aminopeptidase [Candidatus Magasanikbacteria bacterium]|nr:type I methionyl aminopeptidase [Candidatus Magasanikbacteria bacterium]